MLFLILTPPESAAHVQRARALPLRFLETERKEGKKTSAGRQEGQTGFCGHGEIRYEADTRQPTG